MLKTPSFETLQDKKREDRVAGFIEGLWTVSCHKLPVSYCIDYWIESADKRHLISHQYHLSADSIQ